MSKTNTRFLIKKRPAASTYWEIPKLLHDAPEFRLPKGYKQSLRQLAQGDELTIDTRRGRNGRFQTRVLHGYQMLDCYQANTWAQAQITHKLAYHSWQCAQRWVCVQCSASTWAAPGCSASCLTPECSGEEMCAQCAPLERCRSHR